MALANGAQQPHVPAWKRLGLKLKYAKDTSEPTANLQQPNPSNQTSAKGTQRDRTDAPYPPGDDRSFKKRKTSPNSEHATLSGSKSLAGQSLSRERSNQKEDLPKEKRNAVRASVETEPAVAAENQAESSTPKHRTTSGDQEPGPLKRRKSVTFTGETKRNDGNTAQSVAELTAGSDSSVTEAVSEATKSDEPKLKKAKKSKEKSNAHSDSNTVPKKATKIKDKSESKSNSKETPEYVRYLEHFYKDKGTWKFNKNHQTALLKNIFDVRVIPPSLTPAVADYVSGLKGAGPQQRLAEDATSILRKSAEKDGSFDEIQAMNTESARRDAYFKAMRREIQKWEAAGCPQSEYDDDAIEDMEMEVERAKRAEAVLKTLPLPSEQSDTQTTQASQGASTIGVNTSPETSTTSTSQPKTSRKRKKRTDVSSDSSSSDSDSSSSDSEDQAPPKPPTKGPHSVTEALRGAPAPPPKPKTPAIRTPAYQHDNLNMSYRPQNPSQLINMDVKPTKKFFDDDLLDAAFPKKKTYNEVAPKRRKVDKEEKGRGFAYTHGTKVDESGSEDDE